MIRRRLAIGPAILLLTLGSFPALSFSTLPTSRRVRAQEVYAKAERMRARLAAKPEKQRRVSDYQVLILAYHAVYRLDPGYGKTPLALEKIAELFREMGHVFSEQRYVQESIHAYQFLAREYPHASVSATGMFTIGDIYLNDLDDPAEAQRAFQDFLKLHPRSEQSPEAQVRLEQIDHLLAQRAQPPAVTDLTAQDQNTSAQLPTVTVVRDWVGPHYTRIVIGLTGEAKFETMRVSNPDRIVLDLPNTHLSRALAGMKFPVETGFLRRVRVGQYKPDVTRVVLDVEKVENYFVFSLPNPFRLVVDVHGPEPAEKAEVAKSSPPAPPAPNHPSAQPMPSAPAESAEAGQPAEPPLEVEPAAPMSSGGRTLTRALGLKISRIVIDAGHGGHDTGTIGPTGLEEKDVVLDVAKRLASLLRRDTASDVVLTRSKDIFIPLEERTAIANEKGADLFVSIHANASYDRSARGIETYYLNFTTDPQALAVAARENATSQESVHELRDLIKKIALTEKVEESQEFARDVQHSMLAQLDRDGDSQRNRGVRKAPFVVLIGANMPSVLCEISFLSNPHDERLMRRPEYREKIAQALEKGVTRYVETLGGVKVAQRGKSPGTP